MVDEVTAEELTEPAEEAAAASPSRAWMPVARVLVLPRSTFARLVAEDIAAWPAAIGVLAFASVAKAALAVGLAVRAAKGTGFLAALGIRYGADVLGPVVFALAAAGVLLPAQRLWQGDASFRRLLSAVSVALVPLALRDAVQAGYMAATRNVLLHPGLSALLAPPPHSVLGRVAYALLGQVDAFTLWALVLLTLAVTVTHGRGSLRPTFATLGVALAAALVGALPSLAFAALLFR